MIVGRIGRPQGLTGEVAVWSDSDDPARFAPGSRLLCGDRDLIVAASRVDDARLFLRFEGVADRAAAEELRGETLTIDAADRRRLVEDEFWPDQLLGLEVRDAGGGPIGIVVEVIEGPAQDRLVVELSGVRVEVPFVRALVPEVSLAGGYLVVDPPAGLFGEVSPTPRGR